MIKKKLFLITTTILSIITLSSCDLNISLDFLLPSDKDNENEELEDAKNAFLDKFEEGVNVTIDGKEMNYISAYNYISTLGCSQEEYDLKMNTLMSELEDESDEFFELYDEYLTLTNEEIKEQNTNFYSYKSNLLNSYLSESIIDDITSLVVKLNNDEELKTLIKPLEIESVKSLELTNYVADENLSINTMTNTELESYLNTFATNLANLSFLNEENHSNINTFLNNSNSIVIEDSNTISYEGYTSFSNGVANKITIKNNNNIVKLLGTLAHEMGHVADSNLAKLENDETYACITEALTYYFCDNFNYNSNISNLSSYYKQRILYDTINSFYGWVGYLIFLKSVYKTSSLNSDAILDIMDNTYYPESSSYPAKYEMLWKIHWINYAYYDITNSGSFVYCYGALNAAYMWNLYQTDSSKVSTIYQYLQKYEGNFSSYSDFELIGADNISDAYTPLKNMIIADINLFKSLNNPTA